MKILSLTGLALVIIAFTVTVIGAVTSRAKLNQVGSLVNVAGCVLLAVTDGHRGSYGFMAFFIGLAMANVFNFFFSRRVEAAKAAA